MEDGAADVAMTGETTPGDDAATEAGADAAADASGDASPDAATPGCMLTRVIASTSDGTAGGYMAGTLAPPTVAGVPTAAGAMVAQDHAVRTSGCVAFDLWRTFAAEPNQVVVLDAANLFAPRRTITLPTVPTDGASAPQSANPHDIAVVSPTKAYVTQYNSPNLAVVDPSGASTAVRTIDLGAFAGTDGIPEAESVLVVGTRAYVTLQQLDRTMGYRAPDRSTVVVIDTATDALVDTDGATAGTQGISLSFGNPQRIVASSDGAFLLVSSSGNFDSDADGGIDVIDAATNRVVRTLRASDFGGKEPGSVEVLDASVAWAVVDTTTGAPPMTVTTSAIRAFDFRTGMVTAAPVAMSTSARYGGLRRSPDGNIWAVNTSFGMNATVFAFRPNGTSAIASPTVIAGTGTTAVDFAP